jgi:hypothetical protein
MGHHPASPQALSLETFVGDPGDPDRFGLQAIGVAASFYRERMWPDTDVPPSRHAISLPARCG